MTILQRHFLGAVILFFLVLWLGYSWLYAAWHPAYARRWLLMATVVLVYELSYLWRGLKHNHRQTETTPLPTFGVGNVFTLARGLGIGLLAGFLFSPWPIGGLAWLPAVLYTLAIVVDGLDGYLARRTDRVTKLGEILDMEFDSVGLLVATALAVQYQQLPWWYLILGLPRYIFVFGIWWRNRQNKPVYDLPGSATRRMIAGFHMGFITVMLWPIVYPPGATLAGIMFAIPLVTSFIRDWLVVSGRLDPTSSTYLRVRHKLALILTYWLPVALRMLILLTMAILIIPILFKAIDPAAVLIWVDLPFPNFFASLLMLMAIITTAMLALGLAGRLAALGLIIVASANILSSGLHLSNGLLLSAAISIMFLGTGAFSLWRPEDTFLQRRAGEARIE